VSAANDQENGDLHRAVTRDPFGGDP